MEYEIIVTNTNKNTILDKKTGKDEFFQDLQSVLRDMYSLSNRDFPSLESFNETFHLENQMIRNDPNGTINKILIYRAELIGFANDPLNMELKITLKGTPDEINQAEATANALFD